MDYIQRCWSEVYIQLLTIVEIVDLCTKSRWYHHNSPERRAMLEITFETVVQYSILCFLAFTFFFLFF